MDLTATQIAEITGFSRNTANKYLKGIPPRIAVFWKVVSPFSGQVEVDESYFAARRTKGKAGEAPEVKPLSSASLTARQK